MEEKLYKVEHDVKRLMETERPLFFGKSAIAFWSYKITSILEKHYVKYSIYKEDADRLTVLIGDYLIKIAFTEKGINDNLKEWDITRKGSLRGFVINMLKISDSGIIGIYEGIAPLN